MERADERDTTMTFSRLDDWRVRFGGVFSALSTVAVRRRYRPPTTELAGTNCCGMPRRWPAVRFLEGRLLGGFGRSMRSSAMNGPAGAGKQLVGPFTG